MRRWMTTLALAAGLTMGCDAEEEAEEEVHETEGALAEHEAAAEPYDEWQDDGPSAEEVPVEADFAAEAEASINETNYGQALDAIEAELAP